MTAHFFAVCLVVANAWRKLPRTVGGTSMSQYQIAQVNIGHIKAPLDDPTMFGFMNRLDELNALADRSPGFVWRLQTGEGNATSFRPYHHDDRILLNMSVWENIETPKHTSTTPCTPSFSAKGTTGL